MTRRHASASILTVLLAIGCAGVPGEASRAHALPQAGAGMRPAVQFVGPESRVSERRFVLVTDGESWRGLWAEHTGVPASYAPPGRHGAPLVDFDRYVVVGHFGGPSVNTDGHLAESVVVDGEAVRVRFVSSTFQTARLDGGPDTGMTTTPFGLWVIDRTRMPIVLERPAPALKNEPARWEPVHTFPRR